MFNEHTTIPHSYSIALIATGKLPRADTGLSPVMGGGSNNNVQEMCLSDCWKPVAQLLTDP